MYRKRLEKSSLFLFERIVLHRSLPTFFPPYIGAYNIQFCDNKFELVKTTDIYNLPIADIDWDEYEK